MSEEKRKEEDILLVTFKKPVVFEGKEYINVDLNGLEDLTGNEMLDVERRLREKGIANFSADLTGEGLLMYASMATKMPVEFFYSLPIREARRIKTRVLNFFWE